MRIPAKFDTDKTSIYLTATLHVNGLTQKVSFLIDTGSSVTTVSQGDADNLGIDTSKLKERAEPSITYAGHVRPFELGNVDFIIVEENGRFVLEHLQSVDVLPSTGDRELDVSLPSVLGMDFLNECSYSLYVCPKENEAFFEKC
ncbi:MAG: retropepsin-like aspartic protease [Thermoplasmata archaeon]